MSEEPLTLTGWVLAEEITADLLEQSPGDEGSAAARRFTDRIIAIEREAVEPLVLAAEKSWPGRWFAERSGNGEPFVAWVHNDSGTVIADVHTFEDAEFIAAAHNFAARKP